MRALLPLLLLCACGENRTFPARGDYVPAAVEPLACVPNLDGQIDASEIQAVTGVPVSFLINPAGSTRTVALAGEVDGNGKRSWALSTDYADDQLLKVSASPLAGRWYAGSFPGGQFVLPLDASGRTESVFANDGTTLLLLGFASAQAAPPEGKTLLPYQAPVALTRYPLTVGKTWVSIGEVRNGTVRGLPYAGRDTYRVAVVAAGQVLLPDLTFTQALRVTTALTTEPSVGAVQQHRQSSWFFECFGEVARASSAEGEQQDDFTTATELRRIGL
jgi:hypothetical protein